MTFPIRVRFGNCSVVRLTCVVLVLFATSQGFRMHAQKHQHTHADLHLVAHTPACTYTCSQAPPLLHTVSKLILKSPGIGRKRGNANHFNPLIMFASSFFWRIGAPYSCLFSSSLPTWLPSFPPVPWTALTCVCKGAGVWIWTVFKVRTHCKCHTVDPLCPVRRSQDIVLPCWPSSSLALGLWWWGQLAEIPASQDWCLYLGCCLSQETVPLGP